MENWLNYENTNNPAIPFAQSLNAYWYLYPKHKIQIEEKYGKIHLDISSQIIIDNSTSKKTVFFPIVKNAKIQVMLRCSIDKNFSEIKVDVLPNNYFPENITKGNKQYFRKGKQPGMIHQDIDEVIIIISPSNPVKDLTMPDEGPGGGHTGKYPITITPIDIPNPERPIGGGGATISIYDELLLTKEEKEEFIQLQNDYRQDMSEDEKKIFDNLPVYQKLDYLKAAKLSEISAIQKFPNTTLNGKGDAYRHALFSVKTRKVLGKELSEKLLTAHENQSSQHLLEKAMDLYNNQIGREIPVNTSNLEDYVEKLVNDGKLKIISNLGSKGRPTENSKLIPSNQ